MNKNPTILVISHKEDFPQRKSIINLKEEYNFYFYKIKQKKKISSQLTEIKQLINKYSIKVDGVISFNDQTSLLASVVIENLKLIGPSPCSLINIQNKKHFIEKNKDTNFIPPSSLFDINDCQLENLPTNHFPFFIKPVKGSMSEGALKINNEIELKGFLNNPPKVYHRKPELSFFNKYAPKDNLNLFISQPFIDERQFTLEGFVYKKNVYLMAITESIFDQRKSSFIRFDFPIIFDKKNNDKLKAICQKIINKTEFNNSLFNLEFFLSKDNKIDVIEMNSRSAFVFEPFYNNYFQTPLIKIACQLSLGEKPSLKYRKDIKLGRSYILRKNTNQLVTKIPSTSKIKKIINKYQIEQFKILCEKGKKLSQQKQDEYTFRYAVIDICGKNIADIEKRYQQARKEIDNLITFSPVSH